MDRDNTIWEPRKRQKISNDDTDKIQLFPIRNLPKEILEIIVAYISGDLHADDQKTLMRCALVSKLWNRNIGSYITLSNDQIVLYSTFFPSNCYTNIISLYFDTNRYDEAANLTQLTNLKSLMVTGSYGRPSTGFFYAFPPSDFWIDCVMPLSRLERLGAAMNDLYDAIDILENMPHLTEIDLGVFHKHRQSRKTSKVFGECFCHLNAASITNESGAFFNALNSLTKLNRLELRLINVSYTAEQFSNLSTNITKLSFTAMQQIQDVTDTCLPLHISKLKSLQQLQLMWTTVDNSTRTPCTVDQFDSLFAPFTKLSDLHLDHINIADKLSNSTTAQRMKKLAKFDILDTTAPLPNLTFLMHGLYDRTLDYILRLTNLRSLVVYDHEGQDKSKLFELVLQLTSLTSIQTLEISSARPTAEFLGEFTRKMSNLLTLQTFAPLEGTIKLAHDYQLHIVM